MVAGANLPRSPAAIIILHDGEDEDQIIKEMEARGKIPPAVDFPASQVRVVIIRIVETAGERLPLKMSSPISKCGDR